jgi:hypothetical protein
LSNSTSDYFEETDAANANYAIVLSQTGNAGSRLQDSVFYEIIIPSQTFKYTIKLNIQDVHKETFYFNSNLNETVVYVGRTKTEWDGTINHTYFYSDNYVLAKTQKLVLEDVYTTSAKIEFLP